VAFSRVRPSSIAIVRTGPMTCVRTDAGETTRAIEIGLLPHRRYETDHATSC
jgi:hypothetical protein